jgi:hypothetical protein
MYDWAMDICPKLEGYFAERERAAHSSTTEPRATVAICNSRQCFQPYPSAAEASVGEINDCLVDGNYLYGACGDAFGCYKWDLETTKVVTTFRSKQRNSGKSNGPFGGRQSGYFHTIAKVPSSNLVLTGGENGFLYIVDTATDQYVDALDMNTKMTTSAIGGLQNQPANKRRAGLANTGGDYRWISSCVARDENWWIVAGGQSLVTGNGIRRGSPNGFISTWHGPTRSLMSTVETRETPQQLACRGDCERGDGSASLISVANESYISHWPNPFALDSAEQVPRRVWCNQASAYAAAVSHDGRRIASGGVGSVVDVFEQGTQSSIQLSVY